jgi:hypothetical protein
MMQQRAPEKFLVAFSFAREQVELVRAVAESVLASVGPGSVFLDEWYEARIAGAGADRELRAIFAELDTLVVVCVSKEYGSKPWTQTELETVRERLMESRLPTANRRMRYSILPIQVGDGNLDDFSRTAIIPDIRGRSAEEAATLIVDRLRMMTPGIELAASAADPAARSSWPATLPELSWPMANHTSVRDAFSALLNGQSRFPILRICGLSETGKSHITKQMLSNALLNRDLACGRFDFKGATGMDFELRTFVQHLGVPLPPPGASLNERLGTVLDGIIAGKRPTLLIFDTYEAAPQTQRDWVENELLVRLMRSESIRVVIVGQCVPDAANSSWGSIAGVRHEITSPGPDEWFEFGRQHIPELTLEEVKIACRLAKNKASLLAQFFAPAN